MSRHDVTDGACHHCRAGDARSVRSVYAIIDCITNYVLRQDPSSLRNAPLPSVMLDVLLRHSASTDREASTEPTPWRS